MNNDDEALAPGSYFGSYQIVKVLGQGAFGVVYEALRQPLGKRVALKVLRRQLVSQQEVLQRFLREAQTTAQIQHPHIVDTFDIGEHGGAPYIAMEFIEGEPLSSRLKRDKRLAPTLSVDIMLAVLSAMTMVHERGVVHRDLKPENIFLMRTRGGNVHPKVLDFGIAKVSQNESDMVLTRTTALLGTPYYMSPEQARESKHIDARSDQWALGVILYECVTGRRPFVGSSLLDLLNRIATADYVAPSSLAPDVTPELEAVITKMLQRDPFERFADTRAVGLALLPFGSDAARAHWADEFNGRMSSAPPLPDEIADTTELPENAATAAAPSLQNVSRPSFSSSGQPQGLAAFSSSAASRSVPPRAPPAQDAAALTAAMTSPPLAPAGGTLTLSPRESTTPQEPARPSRTWIAPVAVAAIALAGVATWAATRNSTPPSAVAATVTARPAPARFRVTTRVVPASAAITLDREAPVTGSIDRELARDGSIHRIVVSAPGYRRAEFEFRDLFSSPEIVLVREEPAAEPTPAVAAPTVTDAGTVVAQRAEATDTRRGRNRRDAGAGGGRDRNARNTQAAEPETGSNGVAIR
ncbi:MAG: protein kinase [Polyangiales bacterium]